MIARMVFYCTGTIQTAQLLPQQSLTRRDSERKRVDGADIEGEGRQRLM